MGLTTATANLDRAIELYKQLSAARRLHDYAGQWPIQSALSAVLMTLSIVETDRYYRFAQEFRIAEVQAEQLSWE